MAFYPKGQKEKKLKIIKEMLDRGCSVPEIAVAVDLKEQTVRNYIADAKMNYPAEQRVGSFNIPLELLQEFTRAQNVILAYMGRVQHEVPEHMPYRG